MVRGESPRRQSWDESDSDLTRQYVAPGGIRVRTGKGYRGRGKDMYATDAVAVDQARYLGGKPHWLGSERRSLPDRRWRGPANRPGRGRLSVAETPRLKSWKAVSRCSISSRVSRTRLKPFPSGSPSARSRTRTSHASHLTEEMKDETRERI